MNDDSTNYMFSNLKYLSGTKDSIGLEETIIELIKKEKVRRYNSGYDREYDYTYETDDRYGQIYKSAISKPALKAEFTFSLNFSQLKRIPLPDNIKTIEDGINNNIIENLIKHLDKTAGCFIREPIYKDFCITTIPEDITKFMLFEVNDKIKEFIRDDEFEFGKSIEAHAIFKDFLESGPKFKNLKMQDSDEPIIKEKLAIEEFNINYKFNENSFDIPTFNSKINKLKKNKFGVTDKYTNIDIPIYVDIYTNSVYFIQNIDIKFVRPEVAENTLDRIIIYCSMIDNMLQLIHNNIKYKLDNGFVYSKEQSDILKLVSDVSNIGVYTQYNKDKDTIDLKFDNKDAFGLSISIKD